MLVEFFSSFIFGRHSAEMNAFEESLKGGDTQGCLEILEHNQTLAHRIERDVSGSDTPLQMAVRYGNHKVCDRLLSLGAKMDAIHEFDGERASPMMKVASAQYDTISNSTAVRAVFVKHYVERRQTPGQPEVRRTIADVFAMLTNRLLARVREPAPPILTVQATIEYFEASAIIRQDRNYCDSEYPQAAAAISRMNTVARQAPARQESGKTEPVQLTK
ncbi:ankyrin repeat domain-containing protein [Cupriavidus numazuensis]|uniref:Ankyrin repeat domain-containing protein n=1 Tax=Cupriavidus numazuensis TaxID=221992 RepID=A0ABM8TCA1_9BURK|nr:ankyrin repeat domain-containing protein [Cupriavidus numazuensis]CAG2133870.1 hypothetical protein LMG26411_00883 [Cupriavidus numazuensis]